MTQPTCATCRWWTSKGLIYRGATKDVPYGACHGSPPWHYQGGFPSTYHDDFCSQHHPQAGADQIKGDSECGETNGTKSVASADQTPITDASTTGGISSQQSRVGSPSSSSSCGSSAPNPVATSLRAACGYAGHWIDVAKVSRAHDDYNCIRTLCEAWPAVQSAAIAAASEVERLTAAPPGDMASAWHSLYKSANRRADQAADDFACCVKVGEEWKGKCLTAEADRDAWKKRAEQAELSEARIRENIHCSTSVNQTTAAWLKSPLKAESWCADYDARLDKRAAQGGA